MEKPTLEQFGLTEGEYRASYERRQYKKPSESGNSSWFGYVTVALAVIPTLVYLIIGQLMGGIDVDFLFLAPFIFLGSLVVIVLVGMGIVEPILESMHESKHDRSPLAERVRKYHQADTVWREDYEKRRRETEKERIAEERTRLNAEKRRQRKLADYWLNLDGLTFESELGDLYRRLGYDVETTPVTGDDGIDLVLKKDGLTTIVQCKSHQQPVGPAIAREIYGALISSKADNAILACTSGFTPGVFSFAKDKPISLISAKEILALVESATSNSS